MAESRSPAGKFRGGDGRRALCWFRQVRRSQLRGEPKTPADGHVLGRNDDRRRGIVLFVGTINTGWCVTRLGVQGETSRGLGSAALSQFGKFLVDEVIDKVEIVGSIVSRRARATWILAGNIHIVPVRVVASAISFIDRSRFAGGFVFRIR